MGNRKSLTSQGEPQQPSLPGGTDDVHAMRRGGARHDVTARVTLKPRGPGSGAGEAFEGWALNVSSGGVRVILEEKVEPGAEFEVTMAASGEDAGAPVTGRVVWVQEEPDGVVAGIEFV